MVNQRAAANSVVDNVRSELHIEGNGIGVTAAVIIYN